MINLNALCIKPTATIEDAINTIENGKVKISIVIDNDKNFLGTLNDGDIRRAILKGKKLTSNIKNIYQSNAVYSGVNFSKQALMNICLEKEVSQIPILDKNKKLVDLFVLDDLFLKKQHKNKVVLMVGGLGSRLMPLTEEIPKPMLKVGKNPILHTIIEGFLKEGFTSFIMCLGYKSEKIKNYFKDGSSFGAKIEYIVESKRMGTAGALTLIEKKMNEPFFVMNGDILTNVNYEQLLDFHTASNAKATMCVREYDVEVPYGVVGVNNEDIVSIEEKPTHKLFVNSGIYLLNPNCINLIPDNKFYDMPSLFETLINKREKVISFPLQEYWIDIGRTSEYEQANREFKKVFDV
jgi:dTDP-glucose pyrophosphorylase/predicted transcriptional regulator